MKLSHLLVVAGLLAVSIQAAQAAPPNVVFIFADDLGWADLHCYGHPYAQTPHLDQLAKEGTRFTQCYSTGVTCCPSRTGFMTSKLPATYARYPANGGFGDRVTITELLKKQGYATGHFGKWHIGPTQAAGLYGIDSVGPDEKLRGKNRSETRGRDANMFDQTIQFIEQNKDRPFYVNLWDHIPHHPIDPSQGVLTAFGDLTVDESKFLPSMREKFALCKKLGGDVSQHMRSYLAEVKAMDDEIGRLLKRLDELGLRDNTIVVFSSDQGPAPLRDPAEVRPKANKQARQNSAADTDPNVRLNAMGYAGPFRGGKHNQYEGGVRIPFIVRWPGQVPANRVDESSVISGADWLPTLCRFANIKINAADFDGEDASRAWLGSGITRERTLFWKTSALQSAGSLREGPWKLHYPNSKRGEIELYNLEADPGEQNNLATQQADVVKRLSAKLLAWQATLPKSYDKSDDGDK